MEILDDNKATSTVSFFGLSAVLHGLVFFIITNQALRMVNLKPTLKNEIIEFELAATKAILKPLTSMKLTKASVAKVPETKRPILKEPEIKEPVVKISVVEEPVVKISAVKEPVVKISAVKEPVVNARLTRVLPEKIKSSIATNKDMNSFSVRDLKDLRQLSGNKKPEYSIEDRKANKQGDVIYHALINAEGHIERFVLVKSSGYQSLDENTLRALKRWKFYPGQEAWVELPFHWSLKGGAVEAPALLRR